MKKLLLIVLLLPMLASAESIPDNHPYDSRVLVVDYNPLDVVKLTTFYGVSTLVEFDNGESIKDIAVGDDRAWNIVPRGSRLFVKPKEKQAGTNMTVITDKRVYHFALDVVTRRLNDSSAWRDSKLIYGLSFRYPQDEAKRKVEEAEGKVKALQEQEQQKMQGEKFKSRKGEIRSKLAEATIYDGPTLPHKGKAPADKSFAYPTETLPEGSNFDYWVAGSELISPTGARDDGRFTYLLFSNNRDMPAVYMVDEDGKESLINTHVEGNTIVVHLVVPKLKLRKGDAVTCILNKAFDLGDYNDRSGTVTPGVERTVREVK